MRSLHLFIYLKKKKVKTKTLIGNENTTSEIWFKKIIFSS